MSDLGSLIVTFQTQLSDVMETVVKTAMYEVTRLVEDGFIEEVRRRGQQVETLRMQLQWTEKKMSDQEAQRNTGRCVQCCKKDAELPVDTSEDRPDGRHEDGLMGFDVKKEGSPVERWTQGQRQEITSELPQEEDDPSAAASPDRGSQAPEGKEVVSAVDVKEEQSTKLSCSSVHLGGWSDTPDGTGGIEVQKSTEKSKACPKQTQENNNELSNSIMKQSSKKPAVFGFSEEQEKKCMPSDLPHLSPLDTEWSGLQQNHKHGTEKNLDSAQRRVSLKLADHRISASAAADAEAQISKNATSTSSKARLQNIEALGVTIKQEVTDDSDNCEEREQMGKKDIRKSGMRSFSCSVKQHRLGSEPQKQNHLSHKATGQEVMKLHSKASSSFRLQAAIQHLHRPMKRAPYALSNNSTAAALSAVHSQVLNLNPLNRNPSTSKTAVPPPLSPQRFHLGDKQVEVLNRSTAQWVGIRPQHQSLNSHHNNPTPHADSSSGPKHLLRCGQCGKCFPHPSNLKAHLQTHSGERPFCCSLCGRSFTKLSNLKAHRRVHTGERPYCCLACGKRFTQKCNLKRHQRIHLDI